MTWKIRRAMLAIVAALVVLVTALSVAARAWMVYREHGLIHTSLMSLPAAPVAIVFGGGMMPDGRMTPQQRVRVQAGIDLYRARKVRVLLMTGDDGSRQFDEVDSMVAYTLRAGVPPSSVLRDYGGLRTFDSCFRARRVFHIDRAILVTQAFHLPRALYLADKAGLSAIGFTAPDTRHMKGRVLDAVREPFASLRAILDVHGAESYSTERIDRSRVVR